MIISIFLSYRWVDSGNFPGKCYIFTVQFPEFFSNFPVFPGVYFLQFLLIFFIIWKIWCKILKMYREKTLIPGFPFFRKSKNSGKSLTLISNAKDSKNFRTFSKMTKTPSSLIGLMQCFLTWWVNSSLSDNLLFNKTGNFVA